MTEDAIIPSNEMRVVAGESQFGNRVGEANSTYFKVQMAVRFDVITEWHGDHKRYRIYDKEADQLLESYASVDEACTQIAALSGAERSARDGRCGPEKQEKSGPMRGPKGAARGQVEED